MKVRSNDSWMSRTPGGTPGETLASIISYIVARHPARHPEGHPPDRSSSTVYYLGIIGEPPEGTLA